MDQKTTGELMQLLSSAKNISDLKQYTDALADMTSSVTFPEYLNELMHARGVTASKLISAAQIQRNYGYQILDGRRSPSRDKVISLCLALKLELRKHSVLSRSQKTDSSIPKTNGIPSSFLLLGKSCP